MTDISVASINERAAGEYYKRGQDAEAAGDYEKALDFFERALSEDPDHEDVCFALALLYDRRAEDDKAIELYERLITISPVHLNALLNLAILYEDHNHYEDARRCLQAVLDTNPNHPRARLYMKDVESSRSMMVDDEDGIHGGARDAVLDIPISDFELSVRSRNCLKKMNIRSLGDLLKVSEPELLSFKNFGETSLAEIKSLLASKGLRLGQNAETNGRARNYTPPAPPKPVDPVTGEIPPELMEKLVNDVEFSVRSRKALQRLNIQTVGELAQRSEDELLGCKNFGLTSLNEMKQVLASYGLTLRKDN
ncbi:MAG: DNA-directed RNA polymerase subunit alpha C-terminal domain-containing protein [Phycisphaerae bacterium]